MRTRFEIIESARDGEMPTHEEYYWAMLYWLDKLSPVEKVRVYQRLFTRGVVIQGELEAIGRFGRFLIEDKVLSLEPEMVAKTIIRHLLEAIWILDIGYSPVCRAVVVSGQSFWFVMSDEVKEYEWWIGSRNGGVICMTKE